MGDVLVSFRISKSLYDRLVRHPEWPRRKEDEGKVHDFYRNIFAAYVESPEFKLAEAKLKIRDLEARARSGKLASNPFP